MFAAPGFYHLRHYLSEVGLLPAFFFMGFRARYGMDMAAKSARKKVPSSAPRETSDDRSAPISKTLRQDFLTRVATRMEPILARLGLEVVQVQCPLEGGRLVLRFFIDRLPEEGTQPTGLGSSVSLDDCALASRALEEFLETDPEPQPEGYVLEVSSPGLDRPLLKEADYGRFQGRLVKLKIRRDGRNMAERGRLTRSPSGSLALEAAGGLWEFQFPEVVSGRLLLDDIEHLGKSE